MVTREIGSQDGLTSTRSALLRVPAVFRSAGVLAKRKPLGAVGAVITIALILIAISSRLSLLPVSDPYESVGGIFLDPSREFPMGTDIIGRDVLSRVLYGSWISLYVGIGSVLIGISAGFVLGIVSTYAGGVVDLAIQRLIDALMSMPCLILALAIMAILGPSWNNVILAIVIGMIAPVRSHRSLPGFDAQGNGLRNGGPGFGCPSRAHRLPPHHAQLFRHIPHHGHLLPGLCHHN